MMEAGGRRQEAGGILYYLPKLFPATGEACNPLVRGQPSEITVISRL
ncbi:hypothetical protein V0288_02365 [Pannus brasiliensis CCIBt3594]|uniref:Uncharacterized protein n=1 Tax=Pannus brasiliensis CCIBt3594 TaxID=1427578 RepID=A0AAW9QRM1_9CHRO